MKSPFRSAPPAPPRPPAKKPVETVNHPQHYNNNPSGVECIDVVEHLPFNVGNAIKYLWRADGKGQHLQDLHKAEWYVRREIERITKLQQRKARRK